MAAELPPPGALPPTQVLRSPFLPPIITTTQPGVDPPAFDQPSLSTGRSLRRVHYSDELELDLPRSDQTGSRQSDLSSGRASVRRSRTDQDDDLELPMPPSQPVLGVGILQAQKRGFRFLPNGNTNTSSSSVWSPSAVPPTPPAAAQPAANGRPPPAQPTRNGTAPDVVKDVGDERNLVAFRGHSWRVCQEIMADVKGQKALCKQPRTGAPQPGEPDADTTDKALCDMVRVFVRMEECCLGREDYSQCDQRLVWHELKHQRQMLGIWKALHKLGLMPVRWFRWANLVLVVLRALFNSASIIYYFSQWEPAQSMYRRQYRSLVAVVVWFEVLITCFWLLYLVFASGSLTWKYKQYTESGHRAKRAVQVAAHTVGVVKAVQRLGTFSAMRGAKHAISVLRIIRWYKRVYQELRFKGNYMMHHLMTLSPGTLANVINQWWATASSVVNPSGRQAPEGWNLEEGPFQAQRHNLPQNAGPPSVPTATTATTTSSLAFLSSRFRSMRLPGQVSAESVRKTVRKLPGYCATCVAAMPRLLMTCLTSLLVLCVLLAMTTWPLWGLAAFFIKLAQLKFVSQKFIADWTSSEVLLFLAFMNQLAALESSEQYRLEGKLQLLFYGSDAQYSEEEKDAEHCFQQSIILDSWLQPQGSLLAAAAKLLWLGPDDINAAFIQDWEVKNARSWLP